MLAFMIWSLCGILLVGYGIHAVCSKKERPFGFWANAEMFPVQDTEAYNRAVGKLFMTFGLGFALFGLPLLGGQNSPYVIISILGVMMEAIAAMAVYVLIIEKKYRKNK